MSVAATAILRASFEALHPNRGVSETAEEVRKLFLQVRESRSETVSLGDSYLQAVDALEEASTEASEDNWDGYGARAVDPITLCNARNFATVLPPSLPPPEIVVEPDGEIAFEWYLGARNVFSVSVGLSCELSYAGLFDWNTVYGTEFFVDELPEAIVVNLDRLFSR